MGDLDLNLSASLSCLLLMYLNLLQAPWIVQQLCVCGHAERRPRHPQKTRVRKHHGICKKANLYLNNLL